MKLLSRARRNERDLSLFMNEQFESKQELISSHIRTGQNGQNGQCYIMYAMCEHFWNFANTLTWGSIQVFYLSHTTNVVKCKRVYAPHCAKIK